MGIHDLWLFVIAGLMLNITPGPDMALVMACSARSGVKAGIAAALGVGAGVFVHITAAALGLSALLVTSALAFIIVKWIGAMYLIYLGVQMIRGAFTPQAQDHEAAAPEVGNSLRAVFLKGALTNALNPKVAIFFLAFLPQFIDPAAPWKFLSFIMLGLLFDSTGTLCNIAVAWLTGRMSEARLFTRLKSKIEGVLGALFVAVGVKLALARQSV